MEKYWEIVIELEVLLLSACKHWPWFWYPLKFFFLIYWYIRLSLLNSHINTNIYFIFHCDGAPSNPPKPNQSLWKTVKVMHILHLDLHMAMTIEGSIFQPGQSLWFLVFVINVSMFLWTCYITFSDIYSNAPFLKYVPAIRLVQNHLFLFISLEDHFHVLTSAKVHGNNSSQGMSS